MKPLRFALLLAIASTPLQAQAHSPQITNVLKQMDAASQKFEHVTADFHWDFYGRVSHSTTIQSGSIYFERHGKSTTMGANIYNTAITTGRPDKVLDYKDGTLQMFDPGIDQLTVITAGTDQAPYENFLSLDFGVSGTALDHAWYLTDLGPQVLTDGQQEIKTEQLDLKSKSGDKTFSHITLWVDLTRGIPLKQVFYSTNGDIRTAVYSNIKIGGDVHKEHFAIKKDKKTITRHEDFMNIKHLTVAAVLIASTASAQSPQLTYVLKQMDTASLKFQRATADFRWDYYERVVRDTTTQSGMIYFERNGKSTDMGANIYNTTITTGKPDKVLQYSRGTLQMFDPGVDQLTLMNAGADQAKYESFLTLGFGGSGTDLDHAWYIDDLGPKVLMDGHQEIKTEQLDLKSKSGDKTFSHITIWVDPVRGVSLKQVFYAPNGDYRTATYSNIMVNGNVHKDHYAIKRDKNTTIVRR